jgi:hypothetical protein
MKTSKRIIRLQHGLQNSCDLPKPIAGLSKSGPLHYLAVLYFYCKETLAIFYFVVSYTVLLKKVPVPYLSSNKILISCKKMQGAQRTIGLPILDGKYHGISWRFSGNRCHII